MNHAVPQDKQLDYILLTIEFHCLLLTGMFFFVVVNADHRLEVLLDGLLYYVVIITQMRPKADK